MKDICTKCKKNSRMLDYSSKFTWCRDCWKLYQRSWREKNKGKAALYARRHRRKVRLEILEHYGKECSCCGESEESFLAIDHTNNDGASHRKEIGIKRAGFSFYQWLKKNNYPEGFQTLCFNCNWGKSRFGGVCPHKSLD